MLQLLNKHKLIYLTLSISLTLLVNGCSSVNNIKSESQKQETKIDNIEIGNNEVPQAKEVKNDYKPLNGWQKLEGDWFYLDNGLVKLGWVEDNNKWYYCTNLGLQKGWLNADDSKWYYFNENGEMLTNATTPDGYNVDSTGVRTNNIS
ncbi:MULTISPECIES: hypothetical protein [Clostridium]|uniref:hypothetical protein n=1 Tax=Clostridium TaxID=1485 RepID=UPI001EF169A6|nr:hypothetical protein [Clostridium beijerinckii]